MKIFISHSAQDAQIVQILRQKLIQLSYDVFSATTDILPGESFAETINEKLKSADVFIVIVTKDSLESKWVTFELGMFSEYVKQSDGSKIIIPVVIGDVDVPAPINQLLYIKVNDDLDEAVKQIALTLSKFTGRKIAKEERAEVLKQKIENSAADYIQETISTLEKRETSLKERANLWYNLGFLSIFLGVIVAAYALYITDTKNSDLYGLIFFGIKSTLLVILLLASSKYSFNLAKTYMNESLKNADRIHSISFGKFYLQVFQNEITKEDVKEIFREWNFEKSSKFAELKSDEYDPKIIEIVTKVIESIKK